MKAWPLVIAATLSLAGLSLASPLAAARESAKTPLAIETVVDASFGSPSGTAPGTFTLELGASSDAGKLTLKYAYGSLRRSAVGQYFRPIQRTETLKGKHGTLVIRSAGRLFPVGVLKEDDQVWTGAWSVVSGTGRYAGLKGGGGVAGIIQVSGHGLNLDYSSRYEGLVTGS